MLTLEEENRIKRKVYKCPYRDKNYDICLGWNKPCNKVIDNGQCDIYIEYFESHKLKNILNNENIEIKEKRIK